tara:strand:- start:90 stop:710 length:621 start_codon:yes stop_codon:yes gene_type:complete
MINISRYTIGAAVTAVAFSVLAACSSAPPKPNVDFSPNHDFNSDKKIGFYALSGRTTGDNPTQMTNFQRDRIDAALKNALEAKGFTVVSETNDADLLISWHLNTAEKTDVRTYNSPSYGMTAGYSRYNRYAGYNCYSCFNNTEVSVNNYTQGTFIIDMIEPESGKSVWRSVTQSKLDGDAIKNQAKIDGAARLVLQNFPPLAAAAE